MKGCQGVGKISSCRRLALFSTTSTEVAATETTTAIPTIIRHGQNDGVVTLNVGGKNFQTLRSTIQQNEVLREYVYRAEINNEIISKDNAIFIDRDPKHFDMILSYLRNKADGIVRHKTRFKPMPSSTTSSILLPKDSKTLTELYFESIHYRIPELTDRICSQQFLGRVFELFGSTNPVQQATALLARGKSMLLAFGGLATTAGAAWGWLYTQAEWAQEKTKNLLSIDNVGCTASDDTAKDADYWKRQTEYWKNVADKWKGRSAEE